MHARYQKEIYQIMICFDGLGNSCDSARSAATKWQNKSIYELTTKSKPNSISINLRQIIEVKKRENRLKLESKEKLSKCKRKRITIV